MASVTKNFYFRHSRAIWLAAIAIVAVAGIVGAVRARYGSPREPADQHASQEDTHAGHEHEHDHAHGDENTVELSAAALKNIGYKPHAVTLGDYQRTISLPGMIVERPGKSQIRVSAPLTGTISASNVLQGEAVAPDTPLFDVRPTHEDLVTAQSEFLETAEALGVVDTEIARLEAITEGVIAERRILEQKYERKKIEARLRAQRQSLILHGLSDDQIDEILRTRYLLQSLTILAPSHEVCPTCQADHPFHVQSIEVQRGQQVTAGDTLCVLADHCELYIEGTAFEADTQSLRQALAAGTRLSADILVSTRREQAIKDLELIYLADQVDRQSRGLRFYVRLPNEIVSDRETGGHRFVQWLFNPGQRVELSLPVERWTERIVVPVEAVVSDGVESYVYRQSADSFQRVPVHVEFRDRTSAVIENDGAVFPGEVIAAKGAFQIHLALKNRAGGAVDPHAGHSH
jgi:multidrug efflux pump subunit AcrA (membrane-fusion protein)